MSRVLPTHPIARRRTATGAEDGRASAGAEASEEPPSSSGVRRTRTEPVDDADGDGVGGGGGNDGGGGDDGGGGGGDDDDYPFSSPPSPSSARASEDERGVVDELPALRSFARLLRVVCVVPSRLPLSERDADAAAAFAASARRARATEAEGIVELAPLLSTATPPGASPRRRRRRRAARALADVFCVLATMLLGLVAPLYRARYEVVNAPDAAVTRLDAKAFAFLCMHFYVCWYSLQVRYCARFSLADVLFMRAAGSGACPARHRKRYDDAPSTRFATPSPRHRHVISTSPPRHRFTFLVPSAASTTRTSGS